MKIKPIMVIAPLLFAPLKIVKAGWYARGLKNPLAMTVASRDYPRGTRLMLRVNPNFPWVPVTVSDFGPDKKIFPDRELDVSLGVARKLGMVKSGVAFVEIKEVQ